MVVCKCRKATKLYCFVHKVPICGECICFPEHQTCVVRTYSEWVIDGDYEPLTCCLCQAAFEAENDSQTTRLGCLHVIHTPCLVSHIQSFPPHTAPAGYACPACSTSIWPPKSIKDSSSRLHSKLKEAIVESGLGNNILGNHLESLPTTESRIPPAFNSSPLVRVGTASEGIERIDANYSGPAKEPKIQYSLLAKEEKFSNEKPSSDDIMEIDVPTSIGNQFASEPDSNFIKSPGATTRKNTAHLDKQYSEISYYADDEDGNQKKYTRRGPLRHKFLRLLLPFWSSALPTLPVTAPPRKDGTTTDDAPEGRPRRSSRMDPRKILLIIAIMACMVTMGVLYYRLAQRSLGENLIEDKQQ